MRRPPAPRPPRSRIRRSRTGLAVMAASALAASALTALSWSSAGSADAAMSPFDVTGRGATVPFVEQEAENAAHTGTLIGPDRRYTTLPSEASGRRAVTLDNVGEYVEFTLTKPANAMTFRYSLPDSPSGTGRDATIDVRVNGSTVKAVPVTSRYGWFYGGYPFNNSPGDKPHHFYAEARTMFGSTLAAGAKVRLQVNSTAASPTFTIDLADFEQVPDPIGKPANALDVVADFGADPTGGADSTAKFQAAVDAGRAQGREVYVPKGNYTLWSHVIVDQVTLRGAGPWYTVLGGRHPTARNLAAGIYGKWASDGGSRNVTVRDLAVIGDIGERVDDDQVNAFGGAMGNSVIDNVWMQFTKVGAWMDGPMDRFVIRNSRILDQTADGVNFHIGVTNSTVENTFVRGTGDDGLAMWSEKQVNRGNTFRFNTVGVTVLANQIAIYGGTDITVSDNVVADTLTNGGGIHVGNRYPNVNGPTAVSGTFTLARNTLIRAGNSDYNWNFGVGAIWFDALNEPMTKATINVTDTNIIDSSYAAIHFIEGTTTGVNFNNVNITGAGTYALQIQSPGAASFTNVRATGIAQSNPIHNCVGSGFAISQGAGNSGWYTDSPFCGPWPEPRWTDNGPTTPPTGNPTTVPPTGNPTTAPPTTNPTTVPPTTQPPTGNLAAGRPISASSHTDVYVPTNAVDGNASTYWESANNAWPQSLTVDLGATRSVSRIVLKLPPPSAWGARTQTLAVSGSTDGTTYSTVKGSAGYRFDPATGNTATITFGATSQRYLRLAFTANTGWPAGQVSEFEVYTA